MRILGLDPGLQATGWGVIDHLGTRLIHVANGVVRTTPGLSLAHRLVEIHAGLISVMDHYHPDEAAVEETFVNKNPTSTLKLGQARGIALLVPASMGLRVAEYTPNHIKKSVVGAGHAGKEQIRVMIKILLPGVEITGTDAADALGIAICHAHHGGGQAQRLRIAAELGR